MAAADLESAGQRSTEEPTACAGESSWPVVSVAVHRGEELKPRCPPAREVCPPSGVPLLPVRPAEQRCPAPTGHGEANLGCGLLGQQGQCRMG